MNARFFFIVLAATALALAACVPGGGPATGGVFSSLEGTHWVLQDLGGQPLLAGTVITAAFAEGEVSGTAGCNHYFGSYAATGNTITIGAVGMTEMYCPEPAGVMEQEGAFLSALMAAVGYRLAADRLEMLDGTGAVVLTFVPPAPVPEAPLEGTVWTLTTFIEGETAASLVAGTAITLRLEGGQAFGSAGCNDYGGAYTLAPGALRIPEIGVTKKLCSQPAGVMEQEARYVDCLQDVTRFELDANRLTLLTADGRGLVFMAQ